MADLVERLRAHAEGRHGLRMQITGAEKIVALLVEKNDLLREAADRLAALEAEASEGVRLRAAIREALDCFEAAAAEGMADRVAEAREADGFDPASVAGLFERRVAFAIPALELALIPEAPVREASHEPR